MKKVRNIIRAYIAYIISLVCVLFVYGLMFGLSMYIWRNYFEYLHDSPFAPIVLFFFGIPMPGGASAYIHVQNFASQFFPGIFVFMFMFNIISGRKIGLTTTIFCYIVGLFFIYIIGRSLEDGIISMKFAYNFVNFAVAIPGFLFVYLRSKVATACGTTSVR